LTGLQTFDGNESNIFVREKTLKFLIFTLVCLKAEEVIGKK